MTTDNYIFDATQHEPDAGRDPIPADVYPVKVKATDIKEFSEGKGWGFDITFEVTEGQYQGRTFKNCYSVGHTGNADTVRIAHGQLSALCHVLGRFQVSRASKAAELIGGVLRAQVSNDGTYNNLKAVFDTSGNKPHKAGTGISTSAPVASATPASTGWGAPATPAAVVTPPAAPAAAPAAPAAIVFPPEGWTAHPDAAGYFYKGTEVLTEAALRATLAPAVPSAPAVPAAPAVTPAWGAAPAAAPAAAGAPAAPWGARA